MSAEGSVNTDFLVVAGVNFHKTALETRSRFAFTTDQIKSCYLNTHCDCLRDFFILSTCNRTEIYSTSGRPEALIQLLASEKNLSPALVAEHAFVKTGEEALRHLFRLASGLESQILGDYEIIGQLKNAFNLAKQEGRAGGYLEKVVNSALQASRQVKKNTLISDGTTSVSFAAIQVLKQQASSPQRVVILGLGKMGTLTLKNMRSYLPAHSVTVVNRNTERAIQAAADFGVSYLPFDRQREAIAQADVLIVATGAEQAVVTADDLRNSTVKQVFDLSVPSNVHQNAKNLEGISFYHIDELSRMVNETLEKRRAELPKAEMFIQQHLEEFRQWEIRRLMYRSPALRAETLAELSVTKGEPIHGQTYQDCHAGKSACTLANFCSN
jgi:glutamyl-tRNA reductase